MQRRRLLSLSILMLILFSSLVLESPPIVQAAPGIQKVQGPQTPYITTSDTAGYSTMALNDNYKAYFKANSRTTRSAMFQKSGYSFELDISTSQLHWYASSLNAIVGMTREMNPRNTVISAQGTTVTYQSAWLNTDLRYDLSVDQIKETLIIRAVSPPSSTGVTVDYLQYTENCYYTNTLTIVADGVSYLHPTNQRFTTSGEIVFNDPGGKLIFALPVPYVYDSSTNVNPPDQPPSNMVLGTYAVTANNGILIINIRIPKSFMDSAVYPVYFDPPVRVQGNARGTASAGGTTIACTLASTPTNGNILVAAIGLATYKVVNSITQTNVVWTYQIKAEGGGGNVEIWYGVASASAGTTVTATLSGTTYQRVIDVCEYSGMATASFLDKTATAASSGTPTSTGTTAATTQNDELWIGAIVAYNVAQSSPTNSFTLLDGANYGSTISLAYLEKIVSATGQASTGTTTAAGKGYTGCIATFKAAAGSTDYPRAGAKSLTLAKAATRSIGFVRGDSLSLTLAKAGTRLVGFARAATEGFVLADAATRAAGFARATSGAFTLASTGSKLVGWVRGAAQGITLTSAGTILMDWVRGATQWFTFKMDGTTILDYMRAAAQGVTLGDSATRIVGMMRDASQGFTLASSGSILLGFTRSAAQGLTLTSAGTRLIEYLRDAAQGLTLASAGARVIGYIRAAAQGITLTSAGAKLVGWVRAASAGLTLTNAATRLVELYKTSSQSLSLTSAASRLINLIRGATQTLTLSSAADRVMGVIRGAAQGIVVASGATRIYEAIRGAAQGLTLTSSGARLLGFIRDATQGLTLANAGTRLVDYLRTATQGITLANTGAYLVDYLRAATVGITLDSLASRVVFVITHFVAAVGQTLTMTVDAARQIDFVRAAGESLIMALSGVGYLAVHYLANVGVGIILKSFGWGVKNLVTGGISYWLIIVLAAFMVFYLMIKRR